MTLQVDDDTSFASAILRAALKLKMVSHDLIYVQEEAQEDRGAFKYAAKLLNV
jgi:hypothetical protein